MNIQAGRPYTKIYPDAWIVELHERNGRRRRKNRRNKNRETHPTEDMAKVWASNRRK